MPILQHVPGQARQPVWTPRWCLPHESAFNLLQKFAWANMASAGVIARDLFGRLLPRQRPNYYDLLEGEWMARRALTLPPGMRLSHGLIGAHGTHWLKRFVSDRALRYCRDCLDQGFHTVFFQIEGLLKCPRHHTALYDTCIECGSRTVPLEFSREAFRTPFRCSQCGTALAGSLTPTHWWVPPSGRREIRRAFLPLVHWLRALEQEWRTVPRRDWQLPAEGPCPSESRERVTFQIARSILPLDLPTDHLSCIGRPLRTLRHHSAPPPDTPPVWGQVARVFNTLFNGLRRHLVRQHFRHHQACLADPRLSLEKLWWNETRPSLTAGSVCPLVVALRSWQFYQHQFVRHLPDIAAVYLDLKAVSSPTIAPSLLLWHFYVCIARVHESMRRWLSEGSPDNSNLPLPDPKSDLYAQYAQASFAESLSTTSREWVYALPARGNTLVEALANLCPGAPRPARPKRTRRCAIKPPPNARHTLAERWSPAQVRPYESALSVLIKYQNANVTRAYAWRQWLFGGEDDDLLWGTHLREPWPPIAAGLALRHGTLLAYAPRWRCGLLGWRFRRVCPWCLAAGYHSVFYQLRELHSCPIHEVPLTDRCSRCGASTLYRGSHELSHRTFCCPRCHHSFFPTEFRGGESNIDLPAQLIERKLGPIARWIAEAEQTHRGDAWRQHRPVPQMGRGWRWDLPPTFYRASRIRCHQWPV